MTITDSIRHGHHNGYFIDGCRCSDCKAGAAAYTKMMRAKRKGKCPDDKHGTRHGYANYGCRCDQCKTANAAYLAEFRKRPGKEQIAREASARWAELHPEEFAERNRRIARKAEHVRKLRLRSGDVREVTDRDWRRLCARYDNRCAYCGQAKKLTMDHIIPVVRGGRHSIGNLIPACRNCNAQKRTRLIVEWRAGRSAVTA